MINETLLSFAACQQSALKLFDFHVQLCEQRYLQLLHKFDQVDSNLEKINATLATIQSKLETEQSSKLKTYLSWAGVVVVALLGTVLHLIAK